MSPVDSNPVCQRPKLWAGLTVMLPWPVVAGVVFAWLYGPPAVWFWILLFMIGPSICASTVLERVPAVSVIFDSLPVATADTLKIVHGLLFWTGAWLLPAILWPRSCCGRGGIRTVYACQMAYSIVCCCLGWYWWRYLFWGGGR